jgi:hypothetical protein
MVEAECTPEDKIFLDEFIASLGVARGVFRTKTYTGNHVYKILKNVDKLVDYIPPSSKSQTLIQLLKKLALIQSFTKVT